ncbi:hypothetical protein OK142_00935 [Agrobacterium sp. BT-220-3]|nr:hypothetical protein [Agrobacterium sp. BT-220-3]
MTTLEEIKKALEDVTPERVERLWWFLHILAKSTGTTNAEDDKWNWINAFCTDYEDDTFNLAAKLGFISVRHDSFMETSTARITKAGMALVAHFDKAPSAALTSPLESLQRENEALRANVTRTRKFSLDMGEACDLAEIDADHLRSRAEAAEAEVKRLISPVTLACRCTKVAQDETCPVGYPSLLCETCDGKGVLPYIELDGLELWEIVLGVNDDVAGEITDEQYDQIAKAINDVFISPLRARTALASKGGEHHAE